MRCTSSVDQTHFTAKIKISVVGIVLRVCCCIL